MTTSAPGVRARDRVELSIGGMTCASCAARIEKKLNRMDGVEAAVNFATEKARVDYGPGVTVEELIAPLPRPPPPNRPPPTGPPPRDPPSGTPFASACWSAPCSASRWSCSRWSRPCSSPTGSGSPSP